MRQASNSKAQSSFFCERGGCPLQGADVTSAAENCSGALLSGWAAAVVKTCGGVCRRYVVVAGAHEWSCVMVAVRGVAAAARTERNWGWSLAAAVALPLWK